ncbi:hypothetical protein OF83DRAFT_1168182 [Amylostereum chailletii]|nr:hypothetical protein OF83DRAFT_1168182 [Amylostereum chailletii]
MRPASALYLVLALVALWLYIPSVSALPLYSPAALEQRCPRYACRNAVPTSSSPAASTDLAWHAAVNNLMNGIIEVIKAFQSATAMKASSSVAGVVFSTVNISTLATAGLSPTAVTEPTPTPTLTPTPSVVA